ncbi:MAG TPA: hypothetical protein P5542_04990 [Candidatus Syntrophosphaera sp.]|jgi:flagellar basal body-associated protein FliL|uniref:Uncharacterized protein n=1 Tax=Candidatus Syntrophosphaera thermopropionivorans TaxID=2593015 RepID=A0AC61QIK5_9BACT|nr:hypothetical protein [Candidatus Syntrophosphaera thermopropionivorans]MBP7899075.1 hypothetical protein [Candidatus Syntrophosphaera sp.]MBP7932623.1 hypothetical protein [Candidatus Syntrophosphaera sp.]MBP9006894.1 hypothetical protein [Candidatus Syntrophosphaera sp.]TDF72780.1 hypothetical protein E0946_05305 [Candidatus Syntrophosphaera thermopropionivorans]HNZ45327.1 hypothetical protein [Candidatus Syntrophosphaera thermopropionivorans]
MEFQGQNQVPPGQQYQYWRYSSMQPHRGVLILIFGLLGLFTCAIFGLLAWIFGNEDLKKMDLGIMDPSGRDLTNAGRILGIISVSLTVLGLVMILAYMFFVMGVAASASNGIFHI